MNKLIIHNISELVTVRGENALRCGNEMNNVEIIKDGYLVIEDGKFLEVGFGDGYLTHQGDYLDANGLLITPGLIDSHTHLVHASSREDEFEMKLNGVSYLDILSQGGGILSTVKKTKAASFEALYAQARKSLNKMLLYGVTTIEAKSGYGLEMDTELKQLKVANRLNQDHPVEVVSTFLGAHAIPLEYKYNKTAFLEQVKTMLDQVSQLKLAKYCDIFCEEGVFTVEESEYILGYAKALGFGLKIHADEIAPIGGAALAAKLKCVSADHLMASSLDDLKCLAKEKIVANILPLTSFFLDKPYAKARLMIENNCGIALSTDYNPGSSPSENIQLAMQVAAIKTKMTPKEVITAVTINASCSVGLEKTKGSIEEGKDADFVIFDCSNLDYLLYHFGINHVKDVYIKGRKVVSNQQIIGG